MRAHLFCRANGRNAEYILELKRLGSGYAVSYSYGKIGSSLRSGLHRDTKQPVEWTVAARAYNRTLAEKVGELYSGDGQDSFAGDEPDTVVSNGAGEEAATVETEAAPTQRPMTFGIAEREQCELLTEIGEKEALRYIQNDQYIAQLKEDGDRCGVMKGNNGAVFGINRKGEPRPLPREVAESFATLDARTFKLDGEILDNPDYSVVWDVLELNGQDLRQKPYEERLAILQGLVGEERPYISVVPTWDGQLAKTQAVISLHELGAEGVVFKKRNASWQPGRNGQHVKYKFWATATCRVCEKTVRKHLAHNSCALELFDEKTQRWRLVGHTSLNGKPAVKSGDLVEIKYLYFDRQLYQPELLRVRVDLDESAAVMSQLKHKRERKDLIA